MLIYCVDFYLSYMAVKCFFHCSQILYKNKHIPAFTGPKIRGLSHMWRGREQPDIKCEAAYYNERNMSFTWELVRPNGDAITLPGSSVEPVHQYSVVFYKSSLDYSLSTDDIQSTLRCIARLDYETYGSYQAKTEQRIHSYGTCDGKVPD